MTQNHLLRAPLVLRVSMLAFACSPLLANVTELLAQLWLSLRHAGVGPEMPQRQCLLASVVETERLLQPRQTAGSANDARACLQQTPAAVQVAAGSRPTDGPCDTVLYLRQSASIPTLQASTINGAGRGCARWLADRLSMCPVPSRSLVDKSALLTIRIQPQRRDDSRPRKAPTVTLPPLRAVDCARGR